MKDLNFGIHLGANSKGSPVPMSGLTVGNVATRYGFIAPSTGAVDPSELDGVAYEEVTAGTADVFVVRFAAGAQLTNVEQILFTLPDFSATAISCIWNGTNMQYEGTAAGILAYLTAQNGNTVPFTTQTVGLITSVTNFNTGTQIVTGGTY